MSDKNTKQKTTDKLIVYVGILFYAPTISNTPVVCSAIDESESPIYIEESRLWYKENGCYQGSANPILFPYTQESYDKLVVIYPNLKPYEADKTFNYNALCEQLLKIVDTIIVRQSDDSFEDAIEYAVEPKLESDMSYYKFNVPINPFTREPCKTVNEYFEINESILEKINN
jgi:hypothetical protein